MKKAEQMEQGPRPRGGRRLARMAQTAGVLAAGALLSRAEKTRHPIKPVEAERAPRPKKHRLRNAIAAVTLTGALGGGGVVYTNHLDAKIEALDDRADEKNEQINDLNAQLREKNTQTERMTKIVTSLVDVSPEAATGTNLRDVSELPGYGQEVSAEQREALRKATVNIAARPRGTDKEWTRRGTGVVVENTDGTPVVSTATHLYGQERDWVMYSPGPVPEAVNIGQASPFEYGIFDGHTTDFITPLAVASDIAIDTTGTTDVALMGFDQTGQQNLQDRASMPVTAIDTAEVAPDHILLPGQEVVLFGNTVATDNKFAGGTGIYVGRLDQDPQAVSDTIDIVAVHADRAQEDICYFGDSGASAAFPGDHLSGPLSGRSTTGYGPEGAVLADDPAYGAEFELWVEERLDVNLDAFNIICSYAVAQEVDYMDTYGNLNQVLADPFDIPYPEYTGGK